MILTPIQTLIMIIAIALGSMLTRFLPFVLFPETKAPSQKLIFLGQALPPAMMGLLVVYCLKDIKLVSAPYGLPELLAIILIVVLHKWKENVLISIGLGTIFYIILLNFVFI